jgi:hypothetical protein
MYNIKDQTKGIREILSFSLCPSFSLFLLDIHGDEIGLETIA